MNWPPKRDSKTDLSSVSHSSKRISSYWHHATVKNHSFRNYKQARRKPFCRWNELVLIGTGRLHRNIRGGEWYPVNLRSRKFLFQSRNLGGVLNESRNLVFLCFFASRILEFLAVRSSSLRFLFFGQRFRSLKP